MGRALTTLLVSAGLIAFSNPLFAQSLPEKFHIPKKFENYRKISKMRLNSFYQGGRNWYLKTYDLENDGIIDVIELFPGEKIGPGAVLLSGNPIQYNFNIFGSLDGSGSLILLDLPRDDLNGNEEIGYESPREAA